MKTPHNPLKKSLANQETVYGVWFAMADAYAAEIAASAGFDWVLIDGEHAPNDVRHMVNQLHAVSSYATHPVVRPVEGSRANIKQLLDIGVQSLLIPMVDTAEQAREMVDATRYPPEGTRGVGAAIARASRWNLYADYQAEVESEICLLLQIESQQALENLDDILTVDGYDGLFIGPADLASSLGYPGQSGHPVVLEQIRLALKKMRDAGKAAGILTTERKLADQYREFGANFIGVGVDVLLYASALRSLAEEYCTDADST